MLVINVPYIGIADIGNADVADTATHMRPGKPTSCEAAGERKNTGVR